MDFALSDEQEELGRTVRAFLRARSAEPDVRRCMADARGYDPEVWRTMAGQLGLQGLVLPEEHGGAGYGMVELGVVMEEMGRALLCAPFLSTVVLAATAVLASEDAKMRADLLPGIVAGDTVATLAPLEPDEAGLIAGRPDGRADGWRLDGRLAQVLDGHVADVLLLAADTESGRSLFAVDAAAPGLVRTPLETLDPTRKLAALELRGVPARLVGAAGAADGVLRHTLDLAAIALAAEQVGGAAAVLDQAVAYAGTRAQFGRPIGSFQAIKHQCADMLVAVESARASARYAAWAAATGEADLSLIASATRAHCSDAFTKCAQANVQIHGGIGFTWEHPAHLYLKRARGSQVLLGTPARHREAVATLAGF